ncbi:MBL fold metallo-hydrolase [Actinoplanes sp. TBRC 11911]|uniref:MBL fold metallo-hydrolase n=1 Tax=Actinoplanes sp. TBRC 11911 TaxID=2729386 RepID=UPI0037C08C2A
MLIDCLVTEQQGRDLAVWVRSHDCEPEYVYITHPHADHFLGLPEILAAFPRRSRSRWPNQRARCTNRSHRPTWRSGAGSSPAN